MDTIYLVSTVEAGGGNIIVWGIGSWHTLGQLIAISHSFNATTKAIGIIADHVCS